MEIRYQRSYNYIRAVYNFTFETTVGTEAINAINAIQ
jgi:hypothetical protein